LNTALIHSDDEENALYIIILRMVTMDHVFVDIFEDF